MGLDIGIINMDVNPTPEVPGGIDVGGDYKLTLKGYLSFLLEGTATVRHQNLF